jgi:multiple sugar transport system permease protein
MIKYNRWFSPWLMVLPAFVLLLLFSIWPALNTVFLSFTNVRQLSGGHFTGLANYSAMLHDSQLKYALINSIVYMIICVPLLALLPLLLAMLVEKNIPGITFFRTAFYLPVIASAVVVALIWSWLFDGRGMVNGLLQASHATHSAIPFLTGRWLLLFTAISLTVWKGLGYYMIIYISALGNVSKDLHEAAMVDGAGAVRRFFNVTIPGVRGTMVLVSILTAVSALRVFAELYILGGHTGGVGGQDVSVVMLIQSAATGSSDGRLGYASALSILLFVITIGPMLLLARLNGKADA